MRPAARIATAIDLVAGIEAGRAPADSFLDRYFRKNRYAGAKDRRAVAERVYGLLRRRARLSWWLETSGRGQVLNLDSQATKESPSQDSKPDPDGGADPKKLEIRSRMIADLVLSDGLDGAGAAELFDGSKYGPAVLDEDEIALAAALAGKSVDHPDMPAWVSLEYPHWLHDALAARFDGRLEEELSALNQTGAVNLRVNTAKATRGDILSQLRADDFDAEPTALSPLGILLTGRARIGGTKAFKEGLIEVQDEGSQLLALVCAVEPGMTVVDFCAGAGGKTLALAAATDYHGVVFAHDKDTDRLRRMGTRLRRAEVPNVRFALPDRGTADRVLLDVPCSGTGRWRRAPESKWAVGPADLDELRLTQAGILDDAAPLVRPGGRLIYGTCSLLAAENEDQIEAFLARNGDFSVLPMEQVWADAVGGGCPSTGPYLQLSPAATGTDGFFAAVLERRA